MGINGNALWRMERRFAAVASKLRSYGGGVMVMLWSAALRGFL
jgi:hypothetical protein